MKFSYSLINKIIFYFDYFTYKVFVLPFEVNNPKTKLFLFEMIYSLGKFIPVIKFAYIKYFDIKYVETRFGKYFLRPKTGDLICASPAFERRDINLLLKIIQKYRTKNKSILFIDVGADFGTYSITVGNAFKRYNKLQILTFEPIKESFDLLFKNISFNNLSKKIKTYNFALSDTVGDLEIFYNGIDPGSSSILKRRRQKPIKIKSRTLDSLNINYSNYDVVLIKIDVEGFEVNVLKGAREMFKSPFLYLLVEDFIDTRIVNYLLKQNIDFFKKLTPYNSWWYSNNEK